MSDKVILLADKCCQCSGTRVGSEMCMKFFGCILDVRLTAVLTCMVVKRTL